MKLKNTSSPDSWTPLTRRKMRELFELVYRTLIYTWSKAENSCNPRLEPLALKDRLEFENNFLKRCDRIKDARLSRIPARKLPQYTPQEKVEILDLKALMGLNIKQCAKIFNVAPGTISAWMTKEDEGVLGEENVPWNKNPDFFKQTVQKIKKYVPNFGARKIAESIVKDGISLSPSSVRRYLKTKLPPKTDNDPKPEIKDYDGKVVRSHHPGHTWLVDLTVVPTCKGLSSMLSGRGFAQSFPYCWWVAVIIDHFSRKVIGFAVFENQPDSEELIKVLNKGIKRCGKKPKHIISDKGTQFYPNNAKDENKGNHPFWEWCEHRKIKRRTGAVGKYGSVAIIERFMKSLKNECTRMIIVPLNMDKLRYEISLYVTWYNQFRTHKYLKGRTPQEVYSNTPPAKMPAFKSPSEIPDFDVKISFLEGRKHLPIIELQKAA